MWVLKLSLKENLGLQLICLDGIKYRVTSAYAYLTYRHNLDKYHKHFELVVNKEDFNHIRPVISTSRKTEFRILTEGEIDLLTQSGIILQTRL